jgi:hypothetical protein
MYILPFSFSSLVIFSQLPLLPLLPWFHHSPWAYPPSSSSWAL